MKVEVKSVSWLQREMGICYNRVCKAMNRRIMVGGDTQEE